MNNRTIKITALPSRLILIGALLGIFVFVFFVVRWCLGQTAAGQATTREIAEKIVSFAPADPQAHLSKAVLYDKTFSPADTEISLTEYEKATALAPNNYFLWIELGKARERAGDAAGAEKALRRAVALAPSYADAQWTLGNFLLRQGNNIESFALMRQAGLADSKYIHPAVSVAWQNFSGDTAAILQNLGSDPEIKAALAALLAREKQFAEAARIWNSLAAADQQKFAEQGRVIYNEMLAAKQFLNALEIYYDLQPDSAAAVGKLVDGDFENEIKKDKADVFQWQIADGLEPQIGVDNQQRHSGAQSLIIAFNSSDGRDFRQIAQTVAVEAGRRYNFRAFYRANLKTAATVRWEIVDAADGAVLGKTEAAAATQNEWTQLNAEFTAPAQTQAVIARLARDDCRAAICPVSGRIWFDDITLDKR